MTETVLQAVETPAPDANVSPDVETVADPSPAVTDANDKPKGVGKRIDELTRNWRETERDRDYWRDLAMRSQSPQPETPKPAPEERLKTLADFEYDDAKYQSYILDEAAKRGEAAADNRLKAQQEREAAERRKSSFKSRSIEFAKTLDDFESTVRNPRLHITADMAEVIEDSDDGPALAYHLGKNPDVADKIAQLPPKAAARELGKIEARLAFEREKAKEAKDANKVSKAPSPPPKFEASDPKVEKDPKDWTDADFAKWRKKHSR